MIWHEVVRIHCTLRFPSCMSSLVASSQLALSILRIQLLTMNSINIHDRKKKVIKQKEQNQANPSERRRRVPQRKSENVQKQNRLLHDVRWLQPSIPVHLPHARHYLKA